MHFTTAITTVIVAFITFLTFSQALPQAGTSPCGTAYMRRLMYETAYSSGASGVGLVMGAYNSKDWCLSDSNKHWCPEALQTSVSGIAGRVMNRTAIPSEGSGAECLVQSLAEVSRQAAVEAMVWATQVVNGTVGQGKSDTVKRMEWTIYHLSHKTTSTVNGAALKKAMDSYQPSKAVASRSDNDDDDDKKKNKALVIGTTVPATVLGSFFIGGAATYTWGDRLLQGAATKEWISRLLSSAVEKDVIPEWQWLRYLVRNVRELTEGKTAPYGEVDEYWKWVEEDANGGLGEATQAAPEDWSVQSTKADSAQAVDDVAAEEPGELWRSELYNEKTGALNQRLMEYAPDQLESGLASSAELQAAGYKPFRLLGKDGERIQVDTWKGKDKITWQRPEDLRQFSSYASNPNSWRVIGRPEEQMLMENAATAAADSMGNPIIATEGAAGAAPELMTLQPLPALGEAGPSTFGFDLLDSAGKKVHGLDASPKVILIDQGENAASYRMSTEEELEYEPKPFRTFEQMLEELLAQEREEEAASGKGPEQGPEETGQNAPPGTADPTVATEMTAPTATPTAHGAVSPTAVPTTLTTVGKASPTESGHPIVVATTAATVSPTVILPVPTTLETVTRAPEPTPVEAPYPPPIIPRPEYDYTNEDPDYYYPSIIGGEAQ